MSTSEFLPINGAIPNLYSALLPYRGREGRESSENFLTEAFAHFISTNPRARACILAALMPGANEEHTLSEIETQPTLSHLEGCRPDIKLMGKSPDGLPFEIWVENKWSMPADAHQLSKYQNAMSEMRGKTRRHLVLITPRVGDQAVVSGLPPTKNVSRSSTSWPELHEALHVLTALGPHGREFVMFLEQQGLGRLERVELEEAVTHDAETRTSDGRQHRSHRFRRKLERLIHLIHNDPRLASVRGIERAEVSNNYGRVCIWSNGWKLSVGLLYNVTDHRTSFLDPSRPLDVCVRIQADPVGVNERVRAKFDDLRRRLEGVGFDSEPGNWRGNPHTVMLAQYRDGFPFYASTSREQLDMLVALFLRVYVTVFKDEQTRRAIAALKAYE